MLLVIKLLLPAFIYSGLRCSFAVWVLIPKIASIYTSFIGSRPSLHIRLNTERWNLFAVNIHKHVHWTYICWNLVLVLFLLFFFFFCKMLWNRSGEGISVPICEWYYCTLGFALICFDLKDCQLHHVRAPVTKDLIRVELHSKKLLSFQCLFGFFSGEKQPASVFTGRGRNALNLENMYGALVVILSKGGSFWEKKNSSHIHYRSF